MKNWIFHLNTKQRLLFYFGIVIALSITIVTFLIYQQAVTEIKKQSEDYLDYIIKNASYQTDLFIDEIEMSTLPLLTNFTIKNFLDLNHEQNLEIYYHSKEIKKVMNDYHARNPNINLIYVLGDNGHNISSNSRQIKYDHLLHENRDINPLTRSLQTENIRLIINNSLYNNEFVISMTRRINGVNSTISKGLLGIDINAEALEKIWNSSQFENGTSLWIFDKNNRIVYHSDQKWVGKRLDDDILVHFKDKQENVFMEDWEGKEMIFNFKRSPQTNWTLVAMTPKDIVYEPIAGMKRKMIVALVSSFLLALIISTSFANSIVKPIKRVQIGMKKMEVGEWEKIKPLKGSDEMSMLVDSYNTMTEKISELVEDLHSSEVRYINSQYEQKMIELQALQLQINPHFLHNTLETINSYAILNDAEEISEMTIALSEMFRYSVRNLEVVTLKEEIKHVKNFLIVEKIRFQKKFNIVIDIDKSLYDLEIAKLSLQPLVENAIHHGFKNTQRIVKIIIKAKKENDHLIIEVIDNGLGIPPKRLQAIQKKLKQSSYEGTGDKMGIGLTNVNRRIQLIFGTDYGLEITSIPAYKTIIRMNIPQDGSRN